MLNFFPSDVSGIKLDAQPLTIATAAILYHRFFKETDNAGYDNYVSCYFISYFSHSVKKWVWCMLA
jgi:hypothetical protein